MVRKKAVLRIWTVLFVFVTTAFLNAQQSASTTTSTTQTAEQVNDANIELMRQDIRSQRKKIVAANMPLTDIEATKFWPVYDRYIADSIKVNDVRYALIKEYAQAYQTITDEQADSFIKRWLALDQDNTQLRLKYIPEFEKVISRQKPQRSFKSTVEWA